MNIEAVYIIVNLGVQGYEIPVKSNSFISCVGDKDLVD
jgi:hypothetical protein